jgi:hypothetical protein
MMATEMFAETLDNSQYSKRLAAVARVNIHPEDGD